MEQSGDSTIQLCDVFLDFEFSLRASTPAPAVHSPLLHGVRKKEALEREMGRK